MTSAFWDDLARDLEDSEFRREYVAESIRIATIDSVINAIDDAREAEGLSKADLARALHAEPATIRRLFSSGSANPTLGTLAEVAAVMGLRITVEPLSKAELSHVTDPLRGRQVSGTKGLAKGLHRLRMRTTKSKVTS